MATPLNTDGTWLCPTPADRARLVDMEERLRPVRRQAMLILAAALVACGPWLGFWTLLPLALSGAVFRVIDRRLTEATAPEYHVAVAWLASMAAIAGAVIAAGGPTNRTVSWLVIPVVTLPARFGPRGVGAGVLVAALGMVGVTLGVDPATVAHRPDLLIAPLGLLLATATLSMALMRSDLHHRSVAVIDPLTGMLNRAALTTRVAELTQQVAVIGYPVAVVVGDLDHFKAVNDEHGHTTGDAVLTDVAYCLRKQLRAYDLAYRIGGEEFLVLVPGADAAQAADLAESLRAAVAGEPAGGLAITMSFGVAASPAGVFDFADTFARADEALYRAKEQGLDAVAVDAGPVAALA